MVRQALCEPCVFYVHATSMVAWCCPVGMQRNHNYVAAYDKRRGDGRWTCASSSQLALALFNTAKFFVLLILQLLWGVTQVCA